MSKYRRTVVEGSCHCGKVTWRIDDIPSGATACNCTICRRYGALWAYGREGEGIEVSGPTKIYVRGERYIGFHFCTECGCVAYWDRVPGRGVAGHEDRRHFGRGPA